MQFQQHKEGIIITNKIIETIVQICYFCFINAICRASSAYLPKSKCKKYIVIKNTTVAKILIAKVIGRDKIVNSWDRDKMSMVGLISYIIILPVNLFYLIIKVMILFNYRGIDNNLISLLSGMGYCILVILIGLNIIILAINIWDCGKR